MGFSSHLRALSPTTGRHYHTGARASTGMVHLNSGYDSYDGGRGRHDHEDYYYPSDTGYRHEPRHRSAIDVQPVSSHKFTDSGHSAKKRTEYAIQPRTRHRSHTASGTDLYHTPLRLTVPSSSSTHVRPGDYSARSHRSPSPLPPAADTHGHGKSGHISSHHGKGHRRVFSTDYGSDTTALARKDHDRHHPGIYHPSHHVSSPSTRRHRHAHPGSLSKSYNIDDDNAYSYTGPGEEARRDLSGDYAIVRKSRRRGRTSLDRPMSVNLDDGHHQWQMRGKEHRVRGPPPTSRGLDKIDRERRPRSSSRGPHGGRDGSKTRPYPGHEQALMVLPHESDDDYYSDVHRRPRRHRSHRPTEGNLSRSHYEGSDRALALAAGSLGTAALSGGYSDNSDREPRHRGRRHHRRPETQHDDDSPRTSARDLGDGDPSFSERHKQMYLEPLDDDGMHRRRRHSQRRGHRRSDSDLDVDTDDEDLHKYRREPVARPRRSRHSSEDTSNDEDTPAKRAPRERSVHRSRSRQARDDRRAGNSHSPLSSDSRENAQKALTVEPPASKEPEPAPVKGILKPPKKAFPEEPNPIREGVAPLKDANKNGIPPTARWTKIDRRLVNPAALEAGNERFEERPEFVIVLRVLTKEEIQAYAVKTQEIRGQLPRHTLEVQTDSHGNSDARREEHEQERRQRHQNDSPSTDDEDDNSDEPRRIEAAPAPATTPSANSSMPLRSRPASHSPPLPGRPTASQVEQLLSV
ncbi:Uncharacterized protein PECH_005885 [Penicillium ucsense]|uniref:DUF8035 domain-containing protein n=1 Tax=Penicillium ucsense TaxID=2839758 RepID=A0A8J8W846_9EURO|nr:Uncharacterized protein PECM_000701 [Penicillium ucsense]KAF7736071.1 Uncharacterized protein PECH_005885 [Penicillium ucsense]